LPKNEDGEFELVLGNKQLLSMFFVVVVLLGVFFVMGYVVGRNSAPLLSAEPSHKAEPSSQPSLPEAATTPAPEKSASTREPAPSPAPTAPAETAPPKPEPAPKREAKVAEKTEPAKDTKETKPRPVASGNQPAPGATFLQLSATDKTDADKMVEVLRKSGFQAVDAEVPEKPGLFRVLVGPIASGDFNKTKDDLQSKGFPGNSAIKKTF
jgi:cytoskeletal protein RodZ